MDFLLLASGWHYFFGILLFLTALFLILLVLVQRGRGGGLAGAFGGMGGQSAFGTKAGDLFTKLTMGAATFWIILCVLSISVLNRQDSVFGEGGGNATPGFESLDSSDPLDTDLDPAAMDGPLGGLDGPPLTDDIPDSPPPSTDPAPSDPASTDPAPEENE